MGVRRPRGASSQGGSARRSFPSRIRSRTLVRSGNICRLRCRRRTQHLGLRAASRRGGNEGGHEGGEEEPRRPVAKRGAANYTRMLTRARTSTDVLSVELFFGPTLLTEIARDSPRPRARGGPHVHAVRPSLQSRK